MKAIVYDQFGPPEVLREEERPQPVPKPHEVLVRVISTSVTTADWRFRTATFPPGFALIGRLIVGVFRPRQRISGREFSGVVVAVGDRVSRFKPGDAVFGASPRGAAAEFIALDAGGAIAHKPERLSHAEAAALPFGALAAVNFVRDRAKVKAGERVLVVGASGGVGVYVTQLAKAMGASVTGVCSGSHADLVRGLGADRIIDYTKQALSESSETYDVIIDCVGKTSFTKMRPRLAPNGRHVFIEASMREVMQSMTTPLRRGPTVVFGVAEDTAEALEEVCRLVGEGALRPVIGHRFSRADVVQAHRVVERRHRKGAVIVDIASPPSDDASRPTAATAGG